MSGSSLAQRLRRSRGETMEFRNKGPTSEILATLCFLCYLLFQLRSSKVCVLGATCLGPFGVILSVRIVHVCADFLAMASGLALLVKRSLRWFRFARGAKYLGQAFPF